ncbi:MAG: hypothetical protein GF317_19425 [Candidatus Lokiarchaeota archaeon]|nr:hypothetical protein [Candidatus Lokiarchaeota archaeon]
MNKFISFSLFTILIIFCVILFWAIIYKHKKSKFVINFISRINFLIQLLLLLIVFLYSFIIYNRLQLLSKIEHFSNEIESILINYNITNGVYPNSMQELNNFNLYNSKKFWALYPHNAKFDLKIQTLDEGIEYTFYSYGLDGDNDNLKRLYNINYLLSFVPYLNGDLLIKEGFLLK